MSLLQAAGIWLIAHGSFWAGCTGFLISYNWSGAAIDAVQYRVPWARVSYGAGGGLGAIVVLLAVRWLG